MLFDFLWESELRDLFAVCIVFVYLEQLGVQQQSVGSLSVVVALFVEVTQLVQVPGRKQQMIYGLCLSRASHTYTDRKLTPLDRCVLTTSFSTNNAWRTDGKLWLVRLRKYKVKSYNLFLISGDTELGGRKPKCTEFSLRQVKLQLNGSLQR